MKKSFLDEKQEASIFEKLDVTQESYEIPAINESISRRGSVSFSTSRTMDKASLKDYMAARTPLHLQVFNNEMELDFTRIKEEQKTKRLAMILSVLLILSAMLIILFAPEGKQELSFWLGGAILISVAGILGFTRMKIKSNDIGVKLE